MRPGWWSSGASRGADAAGAAEEFEFGEQAVEPGGCGAGGAEEVELVAARGTALGGDADRVDGCGRWIAFERESQTAQPHPRVGAGRGETQPQRVSAAVAESEFDLEFAAGEVAQRESREEAGEQRAGDEEQRFELFERRLGVGRFLESQSGGRGDRGFARRAAQRGEGPRETGAEPCRDGGGREREERAEPMDAEARQRIGERVAGCEQIHRQRRQERRLVAGRHDAGGADLAARGEVTRGEQRQRARRRDRGDGGEPLGARAFDERAGERRFAREEIPETRCVEVYGGFAGADAAAHRHRLGARRCGERDVEERVARGAFECGMRDAHDRARRRARARGRAMRPRARRRARRRAKPRAASRAGPRPRRRRGAPPRAPGRREAAPRRAVPARARTRRAPGRFASRASRVAPLHCYRLRARRPTDCRSRAMRDSVGLLQRRSGM